MKVGVFGAGGMLGRAVVAALYRAGHTPLPFTRAQCDISNRSDVLIRFMQQRFDVAINAAGVTTRFPLEPAARTKMALANAAGPHVLAELADLNRVRLVHVSTDCVFSGVPDKREPARRYRVDDPPDPDDFYGRTKLLGEPPTALVVRTSFVGLEGGLLAWFLEGVERGNLPLIGWRRAFWTGSTVDAVAEVLVMLAADDARTGIVHLATREKLNKYDVLRIFADAFYPAKHPEIAPSDAPAIDRALHPDVLLPSLAESLGPLVARHRGVPV